MTYFLGIDAGGSNCRARLIDAAGATIGEGRSGTANARIGIDALYDTLKDTADQAVAQAGLTPSQRAQIRAGMGIAGITRPGVREALGELDFGFASVAYATDAQIANLGAHGGEDGAILIIGTGSAAQLRVHGEDFTIGGYGFPISDEGSGAALGATTCDFARIGKRSSARNAASRCAWFQNSTSRLVGKVASRLRVSLSRPDQPAAPASPSRTSRPSAIRVFFITGVR